jgi:hypothetical protein
MGLPLSILRLMPSVVGPWKTANQFSLVVLAGVKIFSPLPSKGIPTRRLPRTLVQKLEWLTCSSLQAHLSSHFS